MESQQVKKPRQKLETVHEYKKTTREGFSTRLAEFLEKSENSSKALEKYVRRMQFTVVENCKEIKKRSECEKELGNSLKILLDEEREDDQIMRENIELNCLLREYEIGLALIMQKYRSEMMKRLDTGCCQINHECDAQLLALVYQQQKQINEMEEIMRSAMDSNESLLYKQMEYEKFLEMENRSLKALYEVSLAFGSSKPEVKQNKKETKDQACQVEEVDLDSEVQSLTSDTTDDMQSSCFACDTGYDTEIERFQDNELALMMPSAGSDEADDETSDSDETDDEALITVRCNEKLCSAILNPETLDFCSDPEIQ